MKKKLLIVIMVMLMVVFTGCKNDKNKGWEEDTFFKTVEVPNGEISRFNQDYKDGDKQTYTVIVNEFSYDDFYNYIKKLEKDGFHYEFVDEYVPKDVNKLADKTETSWTGNKGDIYIIANWRSNENTYYDGYNLQLLFYNYNYLNNN